MTASFAFEGPADLQSVVLQALRQVVDPEMALNIVDLGLVYAVTLDDSSARVSMTMTSPACPVVELIVEDVTEQLGRALGRAYGVDVAVGWDPAWTPARMSERARHVMGWS